MTTLEILLTIVLWVLYGIIAAHRSWKYIINDQSSSAIVYAIYIIAAPLVFVIKALYGAFKEYK